MENEHGIVKGAIIWINLKHTQSLTQKNCCILSKIEENGKTFALLPSMPGTGKALDDDDDCYVTVLCVKTSLSKICERDIISSIGVFIRFLLKT